MTSEILNGSLGHLPPGPFALVHAPTRPSSPDRQLALEEMKVMIGCHQFHSVHPIPAFMLWSLRRMLQIRFDHSNN
jgi:hypothetical protein